MPTADGPRAGAQPSLADGPFRDRVASLARAIATVPLREVKGYLCRAVRSKYLKDCQPPEPLYFLASARAGARFTPVGGPAGLYLADRQDVALAEIRDIAFDTAGKLRPLRRRDAVTLVTALTRVGEVLNLTDPAVCRQIGVTPAEVVAEWKDELEIYLAGRGALPLTQQIGLAAHLTGRVRGILYPSARHSGGICLCVFPDRLSAADGDVVRVSGTYRQRLP
ncbi:MAG: RES family NAD+ phosphorylase [Longimicrobiaceae bacterium]